MSWDIHFPPSIDWLASMCQAPCWPETGEQAVHKWWAKGHTVLPGHRQFQFSNFFCHLQLIRILHKSSISHFKLALHSENEIKKVMPWFLFLNFFLGFMVSDWRHFAFNVTALCLWPSVVSTSRLQLPSLLKDSKIRPRKNLVVFSLS